MAKKDAYKEAIETLNGIRMSDKDMVGIFFLGTQLCLGKTRLYASMTSARRRIIDELRPHTPMTHGYEPSRSYTYYYQEGSPEFKKYEKQYLIEKAKYDTKLKAYKTKVKRASTETEEVITKLQESGMLEFRLLGDRSPRFPYNKPGIEQEQADRLAKMLDANDDEMVNLALTVLQNIGKNEDKKSD